MECVALDTIGPITMANDKTSVILTMVDLYTRTGEACALRQQRTKHIAETFVVKWVCKYGFPRTIVCDNGPGFASKVMKAAMKLLGIKTHYALPYHPQSNGACERLNATIINMLSSYTRDKKNMWSSFLPYIVFAYNTIVHTSTGFTPNRLLQGLEAVIGSEAFLRTRNEHEDYPTYIKNIQHNMATAHGLISQRVQQAAEARNMVNEQYDKVSTYNIGDQVYVYWPPKSSKKDRVSGKLVSPYRGPFTVTHQFNAVSYRVKENGTNRHVSVHISRMKKAVSRDHSLVSGDQDETDVGVGGNAPERDHGVHEQTRKQRQHRIQRHQHDIQQESDSEDEEGQVPAHIAERIMAHRAGAQQV